MKIYLDVEQGSDKWRQLRLGIPTASNFHRIVTKKKCELSAQAADYALRLVAERLLNATSESTFSSPWMDRGNLTEADAVRQYEFTYEVVTMPVGFITTDDGLIGCSPDRLVAGDKRVALEVKCPSPHVHLGYLLNGVDDDYKPQVQGQILVAELDHAELYAFHPQMPAARIETERDPEYVAKLDAALRQFTDNLGKLFERAQALGVYQPAARVASRVEAIEADALAKHFKRETQDRFIKEGFVA